jgi:hypothetical protein
MTSLAERSGVFILLFCYSIFFLSVEFLLETVKVVFYSPSL